MTFGDVYYIINLRCANVICHTPIYYPPDLSDINNDLYDTLTTWTVMKCGGLPMVEPGDSANSAMIQVIKGECGDLIMPQGCVDPICISQDELDTLATWIDAGAPR